MKYSDPKLGADREEYLLAERGLLVVISGPSGAGKTAICDRLCQVQGVVRAITSTTRESREGEVDGIDYHFLDREEFEKQVNQGGFLEHAEVHQNFYGSPVAAIEEQLESAEVVLLNIDVQGAMQLMDGDTDALFIFIEPPSVAELKRRMESRGDPETETMELRIKNAQVELKLKDRYDHCVVNEDLDVAVGEVRALIEESITSRRSAGNR